MFVSRSGRRESRLWQSTRPAIGPPGESSREIRRRSIRRRRPLPAYPAMFGCWCRSMDPAGQPTCACCLHRMFPRSIAQRWRPCGSGDFFPLTATAARSHGRSVSVSNPDRCGTRLLSLNGSVGRTLRLRFVRDGHVQNLKRSHVIATVPPQNRHQKQAANAPTVRSASCLSTTQQGETQDGRCGLSSAGSPIDQVSIVCRSTEWTNSCLSSRTNRVRAGYPPLISHVAKDTLNERVRTRSRAECQDLPPSLAPGHWFHQALKSDHC